MLSIRYKSPEHSLQSMQQEKEAPLEVHSENSKMAGINHLLDVAVFPFFFFFYCWQYSKPRQPAWSQWLILEGGRGGGIFCHLSSQCILLNFNSHLLVFFKVVYSSLLFLTPDCLWIDDASHLRVNKGTRHIASAKEMHSNEEMCGYFL